MRVKFRLKRKHIAKGIKFSHNKCPIALVLKQEFPLRSVYVMPDHCWMNSDEPIQFPRSVRRFITQFDVGIKRKCKPFNFILDIP